LLAPRTDDSGPGSPSKLIIPTEGNAGSGGYLDFVFRGASKELFGIEVLGPLKFEMGRNSDYKEVKLEVNGKVKLRFAQAYGFRNIQNVMKRLKIRNKDSSSFKTNAKFVGGRSDEQQHISKAVATTQDDLPLHFVEIMACPGGCLNGGGQLVASPTSTDEPTSTIGGGEVVEAAPPTTTSKRRVEHLDNLMYSDPGAVVVPPKDLPLLPYVYDFLTRAAAADSNCTATSNGEKTDDTKTGLVGDGDGLTRLRALQATFKSLATDMRDPGSITNMSTLKW